MKIYVDVINQKLKIVSNTKNLVSGSQNFVRFFFNLDSDWDGLTVFAQFQQNGTAYNQYLDNESSVYLPAEITEGIVDLSLKGTGGTTIATVNYLTFNVDKNIILSNAQSTEISTSLYEQLVNRVSALTSSPAGSGGDTGTEVRDARVGWDGTEYNNLGDAVRRQVSKAVNGGNRFLNIDRLVSLFSGDFNNIPNNRIYPVNMDFTDSAAASANITAASAHAPLALAGGTLITLGRTVSENHQNGDVQIFTTPDGADWTGEILVREYWDGWNAWHSLTDAAKRVWKGLKVSVLGDSVSSYSGHSVGNAYYSSSKIPSVNSMWWKQLCRITGAEPLVIDAYASSCCAVASASWTSSITPAVDDSRCRALHTGSTSSGNRIDPDIILIAMGLNDFQANVPLGAWDGHEALSSSDTATWRGAYANMLLKIHTEYPDALVFCLSPWFFVRGSSSGVNVNSGGNTYQDFEDAMREVCNILGGVFIDCSNFGFTRQNYAAPKFALTDNTPDGSIFHPNATGQEILGQCIAAAVREKAVGYVNWLKAQRGV